ncbi:MAG TPA: acyltransferase [Lysobacter sp.]
MSIAERLLPNPGKNVPYLDAIRGIAVLFVLIRHSWGLSGAPGFHLGPVELNRFIMMMSSGVDLFFVLSGVLLSGSFLRADADGRPAPGFREYMSARILRIGPPYWVVLFLVVLLYTPQFIPQDRVWSSTGLAMLLAHATFAQSLFMFSFGAYTVATPFWTLTVEMVFYLILPLVVRAFYRGRWWQGVVVAIVASMTWLYLCRYHMDGLVAFIGNHSFGLGFGSEAIRFFLSHQILGYLPHFAIGIAISAILQRKHRAAWTREQAGLVYFFAGLVLLALSLYTLGGLSVAHGYYDPIKYMSEDTPAALTYYYFESLPFAISYGLIILGAALAPQRLRDMVSGIPFLCLFGVLGYSIYLIHMPLLYTINNHWWFAADPRPAWHFAKLLVAGGSVIVVLSLGLFFAIEKPSMIWASRRRKHPVPHAQLSATEVQG